MEFNLDKCEVVHFGTDTMNVGAQGVLRNRELWLAIPECGLTGKYRGEEGTQDTSLH